MEDQSETLDDVLYDDGKILIRKRDPIRDEGTINYSGYVLEAPLARPAIIMAETAIHHLVAAIVKIQDERAELAGKLVVFANELTSERAFSDKLQKELKEATDKLVETAAELPLFSGP